VNHIFNIIKSKTKIFFSRFVLRFHQYTHNISSWFYSVGKIVVETAVCRSIFFIECRINKNADWFFADFAHWVKPDAMTGKRLAHALTKTIFECGLIGSTRCSSLRSSI